MEEVTLATLCGGKMQAIFDRELRKVMENVDDLSTPAQKAREITLKVRCEPAKDRATMTLSCSGASKLAAHDDEQVAVCSAEVGFDKGRLVAYVKEQKVYDGENVATLPQRKVVI